MVDFREKFFRQKLFEIQFSIKKVMYKIVVSLTVEELYDVSELCTRRAKCILCALYYLSAHYVKLMAQITGH